MTGVKTATVPLAVFGDLDGDLWGVVVGGEQPQAAVARLTDAGVELRAADLDLSDDEVWELTGADYELRVERAEATTGSEDRDASLEPCRVSGSVALDGNRREFDIGGVRSSALESDGRGSLRLFAAWFPAGHEIALLASRPKGAKGHDRERLDVVARGEEHPLVIDPRLSTTYDDHGAPRRVGLELWLGDAPDGDLLPRRVAGSSTGSSVDGEALSAHAFACVSRGEPGAGIYVLLRP
ncbi:MAG TPA: hypothetical protein VHU61_17425 [Solirubrobacteraceae bacterium]|jgi:hypothetical protein|nr:hypothetical protein [Solirubrobacteraceae bacterium]